MYRDFSDACRHIDNGSTVTLIFFGGLNEPFLNHAFLEPAGLNGLFLRDLRGDWYTGGVVGIADDFETSMDWVHAQLVAEGSRYPVMAGQSSGGYAALRAAIFIRPCAVIAFAPQTGNRPGLNGQMQPHVELPSIAGLYQATPPGCPIVLHIARNEDSHRDQFFWDDWEHARTLEHLPDLTVIRHPTDAHAVSLYLYGQGLFYESIVNDIRLYARPRLMLPMPASA